jgi:hypothetical protein
LGRALQIALIHEFSRLRKEAMPAVLVARPAKRLDISGPPAAEFEFLAIAKARVRGAIPFETKALSPLSAAAISAAIHEPLLLVRIL